MRAYALRNAIAKPEHQISFPAENYKRELRALEQDVSACQAAEYLNVSDFTFDQMEKAGLVKPRLSLPKMRDAYNYEDLDEFLAKLTCNAKPLPQNPEGLAPINKIGLYAKTKMVIAFEQILDGSIKRIFVSNVGRAIGAIWIDPIEIGALIDADLEAPSELICRTDLANLLRVNTITVAHLCKSGFFQTIMGRHPRNGCRLKSVTREEIDEFLEKYISGGELVEKTGLQGNRLFARLQKLGIDPIDLPPKIGKIYLRSQIPTEML